VALARQDGGGYGSGGKGNLRARRTGKEFCMGHKSRGRRATSVPASTPSTSQFTEAAGGDRVGGSREGSATDAEAQPQWPAWARVAVSIFLLFHSVAVLTGALGVPPSSLLERSVADVFLPYYGFFDLGYAYRFYTEPPPTPVVTATLHFRDQPDETVRLPGRKLAGPRMRHQRQLALANALSMDVQEAKERMGAASQSVLARAYARHLCKSRPGCQSVILHVQQHLIPDLDRVREAERSPGAARFDLFAESLFTTPEWVGEYSCDSF
jgi:hypothetical protein